MSDGECCDTRHWAWPGLAPPSAGGLQVRGEGVVEITEVAHPAVPRQTLQRGGELREGAGPDVLVVPGRQDPHPDLRLPQFQFPQDCQEVPDCETPGVFCPPDLEYLGELL